jgi:hypothetical protein
MGMGEEDYADHLASTAGQHLGPYIVAVGTVLEGHVFYGPFQTMTRRWTLE